MQFRHIDKLVAVDISPKMVALAHNRLKNCGNVKILENDWTKNMHQIIRPDCVLIKNVLHLLPDVGEMIFDMYDLVDYHHTIIICETISPNQKCNKFVRGLFGIVDGENYKKNFFTSNSLEKKLRSGRLVPCSRPVLIPQFIDVQEWLHSKCASRESYVAGIKYISTESQNIEIKNKMKIKFDDNGIPEKMLRLQYVRSYHFDYSDVR
jgi:hypothetical protein